MLKKLNKSIEIKKPRAILFDTDNTLYDYKFANEKAEIATSKKALNTLGIKEADFKKAYKLSKQQIKKQLGKTASSHSRLLYFQRLLENLGFKAKLMSALDLEQTFWRTFLANAPLFPNVMSFLNYLRIKDIKIAIITDLTSHIQLRKLTYLGLQDMFDAVVTSEEVGADKPDVRNFELTLQKLNINKSEHIWMIGDNPETDIIGGKKIGAITFQKIHHGVIQGNSNSKPDFTFEEFQDLNKFCNKLI
tara:strand:- start:3933 stop:4676 length:744 start_codon:yes stop_codon:yes gene_type:complete